MALVPNSQRINLPNTTDIEKDVHGQKRLLSIGPRFLARRALAARHGAAGLAYRRHQRAALDKPTRFTHGCKTVVWPALDSGSADHPQSFTQRACLRRTRTVLADPVLNAVERCGHPRAVDLTVGLGYLVDHGRLPAITRDWVDRRPPAHTNRQKRGRARVTAEGGGRRSLDLPLLSFVWRSILWPARPLCQGALPVRRGGSIKQGAGVFPASRREDIPSA